MIERVNTYSLNSLLKRYNIIRDVLTLVNKGVQYKEIEEQLNVSQSFISIVVSANKDILGGLNNETKEG